ncbi:hypothetical protein [Atlantibacter sp.]|uniref:hypothetical protein n=1 Tax=Atlantibacter sp. TaxID=1903473 RepID=UPI002897D2E8|nr:hypothetical protein [Atlantibacter sp.]
MKHANNLLNRKISKFLFFVGITLSFAIPFTLYSSLNRIIYHVPEYNSPNNNVIYAIDECSYKNGELKVFGWATPVDGYGSVLVFANLDGKTISLRTSVMDRPDVSKEFKKGDQYNRAGFKSSLKIGKGIEKIIISIQITRKDKTYVVQHECK